MVHTTRHHDYDHDLDYDASEASQPSSPVAPTSTTPVKKRAPRQKKAHAKVPVWAQFPILVLSNMVLSALLYTVVIPFTAGDLATVSRTPSGPEEIASLVAVRAAELAFVWFTKYDGYDLAAITILTQMPYLFLITAFYSIRPSTAVASLLVDVLAVLIPSQLLRPLSAAHDPKSPARSITNRAIVSDLPVQGYVSSLGAAIYALTLTLGLQLFRLPSVLVYHFDDISSLSFVYSPALLAKLLLAFAPMGIASKIFIFTPATASKRDRRDAQVDKFHPELASFGETLLYNLWGGRKRTRVTIIRTATLAALTFAHTWLQVSTHVAGTDHFGSIVWAATWSFAAASTGLAFWWVADVDEVKEA